jgi:hypothetical protein
MLVHFVAVWSNFRPFGIFHCHLVHFAAIWYIFRVSKTCTHSLPSKTQEYQVYVWNLFRSRMYLWKKLSDSSLTSKSNFFAQKEFFVEKKLFWKPKIYSVAIFNIPAWSTLSDLNVSYIYYIYILYIYIYIYNRARSFMFVCMQYNKTVHNVNYVKSLR